MSNFNGDFIIASASLDRFWVRCPACCQLKELGKNHLNNYCLQLCMTKNVLSAVKSNTEITISFSVISLNLSNLLA